MSLIASNVSVTRDGNKLINNISLRIEGGEFLAVLGPNGAGKSTLLKILSGELEPDRGLVTCNGRLIREWRSKQLAQTRAVLPQQSHLDFAFKVHEVVAMGLSPFPGQDAMVEGQLVTQAMQQCDVLHLAQRSYLSLSGGEQQRSQLARVLVQIWRRTNEDNRKPRFLLLDEPTSALDVAHQHQVLTIVKQFAADNNIAVLAVLHDLNLASIYADKVVLMQNGQLVREGTPLQVYQKQTLADVFGLAVHIMPMPDMPQRPLVVATGV